MLLKMLLKKKKKAQALIHINTEKNNLCSIDIEP